jgi:zinc protease
MSRFAPLAVILSAFIACNGEEVDSGIVGPVPDPVPAAEAKLDIPFQEFTLENGLRVVVHEDRKAPIVAVNVWYHVGSKDEIPGKTGFAHLFEHLMFQSSENHPGEYFDPFEKVGATDMNGTTNNDRTNYFQNVPTTALDTALWMESDRMGHLLGAVTQAGLDEQRGVVQNEKRQGENQPYGHVWTALDEALYPPEHPYHHSVIGSLADLDAASLEDVQTWFKTWYGPNNAVLVLAGDIDVATAKEKVTKYFGDIAPGPAVVGTKAPLLERPASTRSTMTDRVAQARIHRAFVVPAFGSDEFAHLQLFAQVLGGSASSRLDKRLVHGDKSVDRISAAVYEGELGSNFFIQADVKEGVDPATVEAAIQEEITRLTNDGPTPEELERARTMLEASFVRGVERIGGFGGKADALAECAVFAGDPGCFRDRMEVTRTATSEQVLATAKRWLKGDHTLVVLPGDAPPAVEDKSTADMPFATRGAVVPPVDPKLKAVASDVDRSKGVPETATFPDLAFPELKRATLANGVKVVLAERHAIPVVRVSALFQGGYTTDVGGKLGTASFAMGMLDEGAGTYGPLELADRMESLGAQVGSGASIDSANAWLSALKVNLEPSLGLLADVVRRPTFTDAEIERVRATWLSSIKQEKTRPQSIAQRVLPPLMYGPGHAYGIPLSGTGTEASIASLTRDDLVKFHESFVRPENMTLLVVGDTTLDEVIPLLEKSFGDWKPTSPAGSAPAPTEVALPAAPRVFLVDQPGAIQANIMLGQVVPSISAPDAVEFDVANSVLGGEFSARLNMNLREDKHWAYGSYSFSIPAKGQRPWIAFAAVQIDKTAESIGELKKEIDAYAKGERPATADEIDKIQATNVRGMPGSYETAGAVMGELGSMVLYGRPDDWVVQLKRRTETMADAAVHQAAGYVKPEALTWVVVGDLSKIEAPIRALNLGEVKVIDADGNPVR